MFACTCFLWAGQKSMKLKVNWVHNDMIDKLDKHVSRNKNSKITVLLVSSKISDFYDKHWNIPWPLTFGNKGHIWIQSWWCLVQSFYRVCTVKPYFCYHWHSIQCLFIVIIGKFHICVWLQCVTVKNEHNRSVWSFFVFWQLSTLPFRHPNLWKQWLIMFCQGSACLF